MWTLAFVHHEDRTTTHGYADTREAAMAALARWCAERLSKKGPASGAGLKVDRMRHLKAPVSPSPPIPQRCIRFQWRGSIIYQNESPPNRRRAGFSGTLIGTFRGSQRGFGELSRRIGLHTPDSSGNKITIEHRRALGATNLGRGSSREQR